MQLSGKPLAVPSRDGEAAAQVPSNGHTNGTNGSNGTHGTAQTLEAEAARRTGLSGLFKHGNGFQSSNLQLISRPFLVDFPAINP